MSWVSEKYVNDAVNGLKSKIEMELKFKEEREMEWLHKSFRELEKWIESQNEFIGDNLGSFRS